MRGAVVRKGNRFYVCLYQGVDPETKKERRKWISGFEDKKQAKAYLIEVAQSPAYGSGVGPRGSSRLRLGDYLDHYLRTWQGSEKERRVRMAVAKYHVKPRLGHVPLAKLAPATIREFLASLNGIDAWHVFKFIRAALNRAVNDGFILANPCDAIDDKPKPKEYDPVIWTVEEALRFKDGARSSPHYPLYLVLLYGGLRPGGELLALRWRRTDLENGVLEITQDLDRPPGGGFRFHELKTKNARRPVVLPDEVVCELKALRKFQVQERLRRGLCPDQPNCRLPRCPYWHDFDLIFCQPNGKPLHWNNIYGRDFLPLLTRLNLLRIRPYDLRHFNLTLLARERVSPKAIMARAGHHSSAFTQARYVHADLDMQREAAQALSRRLASNGFLTEPGSAGVLPPAGG